MRCKPMAALYARLFLLHFGNVTLCHASAALSPHFGFLAAAFRVQTFFQGGGEPSPPSVRSDIRT